MRLLVASTVLLSGSALVQPNLPLGRRIAPWVLRTAASSSFDGDDKMNDNNLDAPPAPREQWLQDATAALQERVGTPAAVGVLADAAKKSPSGELPPELFTALFKFELDTFQLQALRSLGRRRNVVVSAPTGSGKTVAGELAIYYALALGLRVFYTTPLKALSNQKFADFRTQYGPERVGLLTGDSGVNRDAPVVVMTTEVYRNMLYEGGEAEVKDVFAVVFDEFHYMNDPSRGTVWEESVISSPRSVQMIALSATMRNVEDIKGWFETTHGPTELVQSSFRPVPLRYYFATSTGIAPLFKDAGAGPGGLKDTEKDRGGSAGGTVSRRRSRGRWKGLDLNPDLLPPPLPKSSEELEHRWGRGRGRGGRDSPRDRYARGGRGGDRYGGRGREFGSGGGGGGRQNNRRSTEVASYPFLVRQLGRADMLPAIVFIFSRNGCDEAAMQVAQSRSVSLTPDEEAELERRLDDFQLRAPPGCGLSKESSEKDKSRLALLRRGVGVHHAGLLPLHKGLVEDLFNAGLIKVCFATETLAAGVNMPARTTVISVLSKRTDNGVGPLSVAQLLQMAGRAGRRGKDVQGNVVLMRSRFEDARAAHRLLLQRMDAIDSHFRSSYGMVAILLRRHALAQAKELVEKSFGSYLSEVAEAEETERLQQSKVSSDAGGGAVSSSASQRRRSGGGGGGGGGGSASGPGGSRWSDISGLDDALSEQELLAARVEDIRATLDGMASVLQGFDLAEVRAYAKLQQRLASEKRIEQYLVEQRSEAEARVMADSILPFARLGSGVRLRSEAAAAAVAAFSSSNDGDEGVDVDDDLVGALLGDAPQTFAGRSVPLNLVLTKGGRLLLVEPRHVRSVDVEDSSGLKPPTAVAIQLMVDADATPGGVCGETLKWSRGESGVWAAAGAGAAAVDERLRVYLESDACGDGGSDDGEEEENVVKEKDEKDEKGDGAAGGVLGRVASGMGAISGGLMQSDKARRRQMPGAQGRGRGERSREVDFSELLLDDESEEESESGEVLKQRNLVARLEEQLAAHALHDHPSKESVLEAAAGGAEAEAELKRATQRLERSIRRAQSSAGSSDSSKKGGSGSSSSSRSGGGGAGGGGSSGSILASETVAWDEFLNVREVLQRYGVFQEEGEEGEQEEGGAAAEESSGESQGALPESSSEEDEEQLRQVDLLAERIFDLLDEDASGTIDKAELYSSGKVAKVPGVAELLLGGDFASSSSSKGKKNKTAAAAPSTSELLQRVKDAADAMDEDGDGEVDLGELRAFLRRLYQKSGGSNGAGAGAGAGSSNNTSNEQQKKQRKELALQRPSKLTPFGELVASINSDNELWLALVLTSPQLLGKASPSGSAFARSQAASSASSSSSSSSPPAAFSSSSSASSLSTSSSSSSSAASFVPTFLTSEELAGVVSAIIVEYTRPDFRTMIAPSDAVLQCVQSLQPLADDLLATQMEYGLSVGLPVQLNPALAGLVECWAEGSTDWAQLCASTSLDQGDLCRTMRRTMEVLRSVALLSGLDPSLRDRARAALNAIDRAPVTDEGYVTLSQVLEDAESEDEDAAEVEDAEESGAEGEGEGEGEEGSGR